MRPSSPSEPQWIGHPPRARKWMPLLIASAIALVLLAMLVASYLGSTIWPGVLR